MATEDDLKVAISLSEQRMMKQLAAIEAATLKAANKVDTNFQRANRRASDSFTKVGKSASGASGGLRNFSLQMSQVAQQGAVTGDYVRALTVQLPDMAIGFGAAGIAAGALAAVLGPMAIDLIAGADSAKEMEESLKRLDGAVSRLQAAEEALAASPLDLKERYGDLVESATRLLEIEAELAKISAKIGLDDAIGKLTEAFALEDFVGMPLDEIRQYNEELELAARMRARMQEQLESGVDPLGVALTPEQIEQTKASIASLDEAIGALSTGSSVKIGELSNAFGLVGEAANEATARFAEFANAGSFEEQARLGEELVSYIYEATNGLEGLDSATVQLFEELTEVVTAATDAGSALSDAASQAEVIANVNMAGNIGAAVGEAAALASQLRAAAAAAAMISATAVPDTSGLTFGGNVGSTNIYGPGVGGDTRLGFGNLTPGATPLRNVVDLTPDPVKSGRRGGGGGGGKGGGGGQSEYDKLLKERDKILDDLKSGTEKYNDKVAELNKLQAAGMLSSEQYAGALQQVREEVMRAEFSEVVSEIKSVSDALAEAIVYGEDLGESLKELWKRAAADLISSGFQQLLMRVLSPLFLGGGGGGGVLGGLLGGLFSARAGGGPVTPGQMYAVNENTPNTEYFQPSVPGRILTPSQARTEMARGGGGGGGDQRLHVSVGIDDQGGLQAFVTNTAGRVVAAARPAIENGAVAKVDRAMRSTRAFGNNRR